MHITVLIPARGGSKGIPEKNILKICDKPLILYSIEYALSCSLINDVVVSTDDKKIAKLSMDAGAKIINRPYEFATDTASTESVITHFMDNINTKPDIIVILQPTSPIRPENSLELALKHFLSKKFDSLLSISPTHNFFWKIKKNNAIPNYDFMNRPRRQDFTKEDISYLENGSLYIFTSNHFKKIKNRLGGKIGYVIFSEDYSIQLDSKLDIDILEKTLKKLTS